MKLVIEEKCVKARRARFQSRSFEQGAIGRISISDLLANRMHSE
jgi:hypothetical protein